MTNHVLHVFSLSHHIHQLLVLDGTEEKKRNNPLLFVRSSHWKIRNDISIHTEWKEYAVAGFCSTLKYCIQRIIISIGPVGWLGRETKPRADDVNANTE